MSTRRERIEAALEGLRGKLTAKDEAIAGLREQLTELSTLREKLEERLSVQIWAELDSGAAVAVGTRVRYFGRIYQCVEAHTKAILRGPSNTQFWTEAAEA